MRESGHEVRISDLYAERFNPVPDPAEFTDRADSGHFELMREQEHANLIGRLPPDLLREQQRVTWADIILFQFPLWWWSMPAIVKGWIDRVLSNGFAYGSHDLKGKAGMLCLTAETKASRFTNQPGDPILDHIERGVLRFCGLKVLEPFVAAEILSISDQDRAGKLNEFSAHLRRQLPIELPQSAEA